MWFLPMLFWCFVGVWIIEKLHIKPRLVIPLLVLASLGSFLPIPLRMGLALYYMFFFYAGYIVQKKDISLNKLYTKHYAIITTFAFVILFPLLTMIKEKIGASSTGVCDYQLVAKIANISIQRLLQLFYSSTGILMTLVLANVWLKKYSVKSWMERVAALSFGVYLFQQFILKGVYDHTSLPAVLGPYWLPWVGFVIAFLGSLLLSWVFRMTWVGKFLIG
jgi:hypothetical protein